MSSYKKLERDPADRVIAGVCSGLSDYFNIDVAFMRVIFVVAFLCGSFGFWLYIILWIVIPSKKILGQNSQNEDYQGVENVDDTKRRQNAAVLSSIILIILGLVFLLNNFYSIVWLWKLWPALLVIAGVLIIINSQKNKENE